MKIKRFIFGLFLISLSGIGYFYCLLWRIDVPISYVRGNIPTFEISIEGNLYPVILSLRSSAPLVLGPAQLISLVKEESGIRKFFDAKDMTCYERVFTLPCIQINNLALRTVQTSEMLRDKMFPEPVVGEFGRPLLMPYKLLLNFPQSQFSLCKSLYALKGLSLSLKDAVRVPFVLHDAGILFPINTDFGTKTFLLSSTATFNFLHKEDVLFSKETRKVCKLSQFAIGGKNFHPPPLTYFPLPSFVPADGVLGMEFLKQHLLLIDFPCQTLYIWPLEK